MNEQKTPQEVFKAWQIVEDVKIGKIEAAPERVRVVVAEPPPKPPSEPQLEGSHFYIG